MGNIFGPFSTDIARIAQGDILSSDEESRQIRQNTRPAKFRRRIKKPLPVIFAADKTTVLITPRQNAMDENGDAVEHLMPKQIVPFADMLTEAPHLCLDPAKPDKCKGPSTQSRKAKEDARMSKFKEDPQARTDRDAYFGALLDKHPKCKVAVQMNNRELTVEEVLAHLANGTADLEPVSCETESALLGEAGTFKLKALSGAVRTFTPCINGEKACFQYRYYKTVGRSWMSDGEYKLFMEENKIPPRRVCIICHRYVMTGIFNGMLFEGGTVTIDDKKTLFQQFCNKQECAGGYRQEFMLFSPSGQKIQGLWGPIVLFQPKYHRSYLDGDGAWRLDQHMLCWQPQQRIEPEIGETNRDFQ